MSKKHGTTRVTNRCKLSNIPGTGKAQVKRRKVLKRLGGVR